MELNLIEARILKAVKEARKLLEDITGIGSGSGTNPIGGATPIGKDAVGVETLKPSSGTAQAETADQVPLARGKLKEKKKPLPPKAATKAIKVIPKDDKGVSPPTGYIDPKPGDPNWRVLVNKDAVNNPEQYVANKHKEEQK